MMKTKKIISIVLLIIILINSMQGIVSAIDINTAYIENLGTCEYHLQYYKASAGIWSYIVTTMVGYRENGVLHYAYCLDADKKGVGDEENYNVEVKELLSDEKVWRAIINGFPYKTAEELGVENEQDAFVATKQAVYSVLYNRDVESYYRGADERGEKIVNAIKNIVNIARNGTQTLETTNLLNVQKIGEFQEDNNGYYSQEYEVSSNVELSNYIITQIQNFPEGSYISDLNNTAKTEFSGEEHFKILIPKEKILDNFEGKIDVTGSIKTYPVYFGKTYDESLQNYALTYDAYTKATGEGTLLVDAYKSQIKVVKTDKETSKPIANVEFNFKYENGENIGNFTTNKEGIITLTGLRQGKIIVTEIKTQSQYVLNKNQIEIEIEYNDLETIDITNSYKIGNLKVIKLDKDNKEITLENVEFDLIDSNGNIVKHLITNENGIAEAKNLKIGNYILREKKTQKEYKLAIDENVTIEWGKTIEIIVENEKMKGQIKIIKTSEDGNLITGELAGTAIPNVKFEIYDSNYNLVEEIITGEDGIATTKLLPVGKYIIKEVETGKHYLLNEDEMEVEITEDGEIIKIEITNKSETPPPEIKRLPVTGY